MKKLFVFIVIIISICCTSCNNYDPIYPPDPYYNHTVVITNYIGDRIALDFHTDICPEVYRSGDIYIIKDQCNILCESYLPPEIIHNHSVY